MCNAQCNNSRNAHAKKQELLASSALKQYTSHADLRRFKKSEAKLVLHDVVLPPTGHLYNTVDKSASANCKRVSKVLTGRHNGYK
jgi:hypothetical protein